MSTSAKPIKLQATERDTTLNPRQLRAAGFVPATIYSKDTDSRSIQVRAKELAYQYGKGMRIFELDGLKLIARAQQIQVDPLSQQVLSIEFLEINPEDAKAAMAAEAQRRADETAALEEAKVQARANAKAAESAAAAAEEEASDSAPAEESAAEAEKATATA